MEIAVVEAMKMQNSLVAMKSGTVKKIHVEPGAQVAEDDLIMEMDGWHGRVKQQRTALFWKWKDGCIDQNLFVAYTGVVTYEACVIP